MEVEERFFAQVDVNGPPAALRPDLGCCWMWTGGCDGHGYPEFWRDGTVISGRKAAWEIAAGEQAPPGLRFKTFACARRLCVNPAHVRPIVVPDGPSGRWLARFYARLVEEAEAAGQTAVCVEGHSLRRPEGLVVVPGGFACRQCRRDAERRARERRGGRTPQITR